MGPDRARHGVAASRRLPRHADHSSRHRRRRAASPSGTAGARPAASPATDPARAHPRSQSSIAVSPDGVRWFLINASPDVRDQLGRLAGSRPVSSAIVRARSHRGRRVDGRRARPLAGHPAAPRGAHARGVRDGRDEAHSSSTTRAYCPRPAHSPPYASSPLAIGQTVPLRRSWRRRIRTHAEAFPVAGDSPRFASEESPGAHHRPHHS